ncbi:SpoIIE family protein phosphatase [Methyloterricola oryzae]|uniref:SpoIIE family protein phosphatase n=1 Tax=Methyloterricola oryzae TaxID=1495050 RepID=UPI0005EB89E5|nr:SpoIIE family protein phosphatase [Methyloterricola oryzae]
MDSLIEYGVAMRPFPGEKVSGDAYLVRMLEDGVVLAVVDGLGHGDEAANASRVAVKTLDRYAAETPNELLLHTHHALKSSRGVAMSLASIDQRSNRMDWLGVGNVDGLLVRYGTQIPSIERLLTRGGVVGFQLPPLRRASLCLHSGDLIVLASDGIRSEFGSAWTLADPLLRCQKVQSIAEQILREFGKVTDDALVLVARYCGRLS